MKIEEIMQIFLQTGALMEGHFILTSGRHSNRYMQCAQVLQYPSHTESLARIIAGRYRDDRIEVVIAPAVGAILVAYEVARQLGVKAIFCERQEGRMMLRRGFTIEPGQRVLVVEDVITTGGSVQEVIDVVREWQGDVIGVGVLVDRSGGKVDFGIRTEAVLTLDIESFPAEECPLCREGKLPAVKPGSRSLS
ncbi:MAG: orotate phosphoribosyltransferase [Syntrophomonadaceae bacterium]|nr:orotate phosphoribosyltransferase [Syntrophomonadaceae bacterium]